MFRLFYVQVQLVYDFFLYVAFEFVYQVYHPWYIILEFNT